jgi:hypothetical protein
VGPREEWNFAGLTNSVSLIMTVACAGGIFKFALLRIRAISIGGIIFIYVEANLEFPKFASLIEYEAGLGVDMENLQMGIVSITAVW